MDVEVLKMKLLTSWDKLAHVDIRYHHLVLHCDLVFNEKASHAWIRMPEKWITKEKKMSYCFWPSKEISDEFQKKVLKLIFDKYDLDIPKLAEFHRVERQKLKDKKNV